MADIRHLPNAPIQEAVVDVRFEVPEGVDLIGDEKIHSLLTDKYPTFHYQRQISGHFELREEELVQRDADAAVVGVVFRASDRPHVVQLRRDRFVFSWLRPYDDWNSLRRAALDVWSLLQRELRIATVNRLGVRYVNRFGIPIPANLGDYFANPFQTPSEIDGYVTEFLWKTTVYDEGTGTHARYTLASESSSETGHGDIIIDIDCFRNGIIPAAIARLEGRLDELRDLKNRMFFGGLTDQALELFK